MATAFEDFTFWYAKSISENSAEDADLFLDNTDGISLRYIRAGPFAKRQTDTSNAQAQDKKAPDTGNAVNQVEFQIAFNRQTAPTGDTPLTKLLQMWFLRGNDDEFRDARFGLESTDAPELNAEPVENGGYRLMNFEQQPNPDDPGVLVYTIQIQFLGDHTILGAFQ